MPSSAAELEAAIAGLETQRAVLGDAIVDLALAPLRQQLAGLRQAASAAELEGEYKLVTVLFADLSGYTALTEHLGPEPIRSLMNACFEMLVPVVERYEGRVEKFIGDSIMAVFGAPVAHENDPERALRAALEMQEALAAFNQAQGTDLGLHFGIDTGRVVAGAIGSAGRQEYGVTGDPVNLASRLEDASERGEILVGPDTYRLTAPLLEFDALPPIRVKGKAEPISIHRLRGLKREPGSLRGIAGLRSPLVGREKELRQLQTAFQQLAEGKGGRVAIVAEAGLGKSRLVAEVRRSLPAAVTAVEGRALSYTTNISYWIVRELLLGLLGATAATPTEVVADTLRRSLERCAPEEGLYPYLARLLELPLDAESAEQVRHLNPQALQRQMLQALLGYLRARASEQPLALVCEDLHWADPSSLQLLEMLLPAADELPLLLALVFRPDPGEIQAFHQRTFARYGSEYRVIELAPLNRKESTQLLHNLLRIENLPPQTRRMILNKAEGNAFFLEEVLRSLLDAGLVVLQDDRIIATQAIEELQVPDTLQGVIMARIDRLPPQEKQTLQTASVVGRIFQQRVLAYLLQAEPASEALDSSLTELQRRELIRQRGLLIPGRGAPVDQEYVFKHVLTQDVTYSSLLVARRKALHRVTGEALEALFPNHLEELAGTLGTHFERAEVHDKAVHYLSRAADRARAIYANTEAITFCRAALGQVEALRQETTGGAWAAEAARLREILGDLLSLTGEYEPARTEYQEALAQLPETDHLSRSRLHRRIGDTWMPDRRYDAALEVYGAAEAALGAVPTEPASEWWQEWINIQMDRMSAHYRPGRVSEMAALLAATQPVLEQHGALLQRSQFYNRRALMALRGDRYLVSDEALADARAALEAARESGILTEITYQEFAVGFCHLWRGDLDEADEHMRVALPLTQRTGDVALLCIGLTYRTVLARKRGQVAETRQYIAQSLAVATTAQRPDYVGAAHGNLAWVAWREGDFARAAAEGQTALELWQDGPYMFRWIALWPLIGVCLAHEEIEAAIEHTRALLDPAQQAMPAALTRLLEEAVEAREVGRPEAARADLQQAAELARGMGYL